MKINKKGQLSGGAWALISGVLALVVVGILLSVGLMTNTKVVNNLNFDKVETVWNNEQLTSSVKFTDQTNHSTLLNHTPIKADSQTVINSSSSALTEGTDFTLVDSTGNFTLINAEYNNTILNVSYTQETDSAAKLTSDRVQNDFIESSELASTGQTVLAAMAILTIVVGVVYLFSANRD